MANGYISKADIIVKAVAAAQRAEADAVFSKDHARVAEAWAAIASAMDTRAVNAVRGTL